MKKERRHLRVKQLYKQWASCYDKEPNLAFYLEEKETRGLLDVKGKRVLDYGCGTGRYTIPLARHNKVTAIDLSKEMIDIAKEKTVKSGLNIHFILGDIINFRPKEKYDFILSMLVLDHVKNLGKAIEIIGKASKIGTELMISNVPAYQVYRRIAVLKGKKINQFYHPLEEYLYLLRKEGFELIEYKELTFEEKHKEMKQFVEVNGPVNEPYVVLMRWRKVR